MITIFFLFASSCVENDEPLGSLLVHDPVAALPAADGVLGPDLVFCVAFAAGVDHGLLGRGHAAAGVHHQERAMGKGADGKIGSD